MAEPEKLKLRDISAEHQVDIVEMLERYLARAKNGDFTRLGVLFEQGSQWGTEFSRSDDNRIDAAMMIELGLRRIGFKI